MAKWQIEYKACVNCDPESRDAGLEIFCFRIFPEGEPERWVAQTNPALPPEIQEEVALQIADALFRLFGV
jgi:hypothetical protein